MTKQASSNIQPGYAGQEIIHVPGRTEQRGTRFHHTTQNDKRFKTYTLFIRGIFHLIFLDHGWQQVTEIVKVKLWWVGLL